jgi:membrane associated rhomboid family serine protease
MRGSNQDADLATAEGEHPARRRSIPIVTLCILLVTAIVTGLQFVYPELLEALRRDPDAFAAGEWWRLLSPLLVHSDGLWQFLLNAVGIAIVGSTAEMLIGWPYLLILYLVGGLAGNIAGYAWDPHGAGASVGFFGVAGGLSFYFAKRGGPVPFVFALYSLCVVAALLGGAISGVGLSVAFATAVGVLAGVLLRLPGRSLLVGRIVAAGIIAGGILLTLLQNNHGPPILAGACVAAFLLSLDNKRRVSVKSP